MMVFRGGEARAIRLTERPVVGVGFFDGVHRGHQALVRRVVADARRQGVPAGVLTFEPHPKAVLEPEQPVDLLTTQMEKEERLSALGIDFIVAYPFTRELSALPAEEFVRSILVEKLGVSVVVVGYNFTFGARGAGRFSLLRRAGEGYGFQTVMIPPITVRRRVISSSSIRAGLLAGDVGEAARMLGYPYPVSGLVGHGEGRGRSLGFPTANLEVAPGKLVPGDGVYLVGVRLPGSGSETAGLAAIGRAATFAASERRIEVHVCDFAGDLYGQTLEVSFLRRLRDMARFSSPESLRRQVASDLERARAEWSTGLGKAVSSRDFFTGQR